jgi:hypothetical protein
MCAITLTAFMNLYDILQYRIIHWTTRNANIGSVIPIKIP